MPTSRARRRFFALTAALLLAAVACVSGRDRENASAGSLLARVHSIVRDDARLQALLAPRSDGFHIDAQHGLVNEGWRGTGFSDLAAHVPNRADAPIEVSVSRFDRLRVRLTLEGAASEPALLDHGRVVFHSVFHETDRIVAASRSAMEDAFVLRSENAPREINYHVELGEGLVAVASADGGLAFNDDRGHNALGIPPPYALDARGVRRDAALRWNEATHRITVIVDTSGMAFPIVVDPSVELGTWASVPYVGRRNGAAIVFDEARGEVLLFGGGGFNRYLNDTWRWNGTQWIEAKPATSPPGRLSSAVFYDSVRGNVILFGGDNGSRLGDTWRWNGTIWAVETPAESPGARGGAAAAFDKTRGEGVLFGGSSAALRPVDTWRWNGTTWTRSTPTRSPSGRDNHAMAFDDRTGDILLFGGQLNFGAASAETWRWDGTDWTDVTSTGPVARSRSAAVFDVSRGSIVLHGGFDASSLPLSDTWSWNAAGWIPITTTATPEPRAGHALVYAATRNAVELVGGATQSTAGFGDVWRLGGNAWSRVAAPTCPSERTDAAMAFDVARGEVVLFGGSRGTVFNAETWRWNGTAWTQLATTSAPPARAGASIVFDRVRGETVLFGGRNGGGYLGDTWRWSGSLWTQASPTSSPSPRNRGAISFDAARGEVVLFGGYDGTYLGDTWRWTGSAWSAYAPAMRPTARASAAMTFDAARNLVVLFGGQDPFGALGDTWTWGGSDWANVTMTSAPPSRWRSSMAYDQVRREILLFGGENAQSIGDTWRWDGARWAVAAPQVRPSARSGSAMVYDAVRKEHVLFGGDVGGFTFLEDTQRFAYAGGGCATNADCAGLTCVDGACCNAPSCGTCQTCAGFAVGRCTPVAGQEDKDTCAVRDGKSCDAVGICRAALGTAAVDASACASGFLVDGVCCDQPCDLACVACRADLKTSGTLSGVCDVARNGLDPHNTCVDDGRATCGRDGTCDGRGKCRTYEPNTPCGPVACIDNRATSRICDGAGTCSPSARGVVCGAYACNEQTGCNTSCTADAECEPRSHCVASVCTPNQGVACVQNAVVDPDGTKTDCGVYLCRDAQCTSRCTSLADCAEGALCDFSGKCVHQTVTPTPDSSGCSFSRGAEPRRSDAVLLLCFALAWVVRRRSYR